MIKKILRVKNIGRFRDENYGSYNLAPTNIIFAENGCGKTTLAAIMHSVARNEPGFIEERRTAGQGGEPRVCILTGSQSQLIYRDGAWSGPVDGLSIEVFDSHFVNTNVFAGNVVSHDHKKSLHRFIIGETGQRLARRIDRIDKISRGLSRHIAGIESEIQSRIETSDRTTEAFVELKELNDIDEKIQSAQVRVASQEQKDKIKKASKLSTLSIPDVPVDDIRTMLSKTIDDISDEAEEYVLSHIKRCMDVHGQEWVEQGLAYVQEGDCPFCGESLVSNELISAYRDYFDERYTALKEEITAVRGEVEHGTLPERDISSENTVRTRCFMEGRNVLSLRMNVIPSH